MDNEKIKYLINVKDDELFILLGSSLLDNTMGGKKFSDKEKRSLGQSWFQNNIYKLREILCENETIIEYIKKPEKIEQVTIVTSIADFLISICGVPAPFVVSSLIFNYGLNNLCNGD